jgi:hypothetical protein
MNGTKKKRKVPAKRKLLIQAKINNTWFNVWADYKKATSSYTLPWHPTSPNKMVIGFGGAADYCDLREQLMHEAVEAALEIRNATHYNTNNMKCSAYAYFSFNHEVFQNAIHEANLFMTIVEPYIRREFEKYFSHLPWLIKP